MLAIRWMMVMMLCRMISAELGVAARETIARLPPRLGAAPAPLLSDTGMPGIVRSACPDARHDLALHVTDRAGAPISDAEVYVNGIVTMRTAADGSVRIISSAEEPLRIYVNKPGYERGFVKLTNIPAGFQLTLPLSCLDELSRERPDVPTTMGSLHGRLIDKDGNPVVGCTIHLVGTRQGSYSKAPGGEFRMWNIRPGRYDVEFSAVGFLRIRVPFNAAADSAMSCLIQLRDGPAHGLSVSCGLSCPNCLTRDRAGTVREQSPDEIADRPTRALLETVCSMGSIRYDDPDGGPR